MVICKEDVLLQTLPCFSFTLPFHLSISLPPSPLTLSSFTRALCPAPQALPSPTSSSDCILKYIIYMGKYVKYEGPHILMQEV